MAADPDPARSPHHSRNVPRLQVDVCDPRGVPVTAPGLARWLSGVAPAAARGTVAVVLASDARMRTLNRTYRGKDYATDVLSFANEADDVPEGGRESARSARQTARRKEAAAHLGDIVIARGVAARQARDAGHALATELRVLALHGLLHLLGYDHEHDAGEMARVERRLRRRGGLREGLIERAV
jgi:probable rRNA maturation factor